MRVQVWMRLHLHTEGSHAISEVWLREVRGLMDVVIQTDTFDDHHIVRIPSRMHTTLLPPLRVRFVHGCRNIVGSCH